MTPNDIEILIHCHCSPSPHPRKGAPAVDESLKMMLANDLIRPSKMRGTFTTTERGAKHLDQLCSLKWPVKKEIWIGADGNEMPDGTSEAVEKHLTATEVVARWNDIGVCYPCGKPTNNCTCGAIKGG